MYETETAEALSLKVAAALPLGSPIEVSLNN